MSRPWKFESRARRMHLNVVLMAVLAADSESRAARLDAVTRTPHRAGLCWHAGMRHGVHSQVGSMPIYCLASSLRWAGTVSLCNIAFGYPMTLSYDIIVSFPAREPLCNP